MYESSRPYNRYNFTKTFISSLPPNPPNAKSREKEYADQQVIGLRILVGKNGRRHWLLRYRFLGKKKSVGLGEFPIVDVAAARQRAMELKNLVLKGIDPQEERLKKDDKITFREFAIKEYIPHAKANKKSWADDVSKLENHMYKAFGDIPLDSITTKQLQQYQSKIKKRNSPSTSNRHMTVLIRMFNLAVQWDYLEVNPCTNKIKKYQEPTKEIFLDDHELKSFLAALDNANQSVSVHAIRLLLYTGLRKSEITTLKWSSVDLTNGNLRLLQTKSGKSRTVILNQLAIDTLEKMKEFRVSDWVCPGKGPKGHLVSLRNCFVKLVKEAGIKPIRLHDLRHVFASICANSGQSLYNIQTLLGHNSSQMTQRYAHLANKELRAATESVADQIKKLAG